MVKDPFGELDEEPHIDLTPLIDCLFMLVIFFVLTMSFSRPVLEIVLPKAENAVSASKEQEIIVNIKAEGTFWLNGEQVDIARIREALKNDEGKLLNIYMDEKAPFARFVEMVDLAKELRDGRFVISTDALPVKGKQHE